ncbi:MAG TPA: PorP/SprF family type IX secretion system membrane protein [Cyclobacteriaceae bacterium]|nr:PorP/SprF family type IX secretion system membrane protein [Cyclobacteriaceae bacterium]
MHKLFTVFFGTLILFLNSRIYAQNYPVYNSYVINPYLYNPAEAASEYAYLFFSHRQQWMGIEGAPVLSTVTFNTLIDESYTGIGAKISNYSRGILKTTDIGFTYAHGVPFNEKNVLFFGLTGGAISNTIDLNKVSPDDLDDPALSGYLANNFQPSASFGMVFKSNSGLNFGITLPQLFAPKFNSASQFSATQFTPVDNVYATLYYKRKVEGKIVNKRKRGVRTRQRTSGGYAPLEFYAVYKYSAFDNSQFEVTGKLNFSENFWLGAGYRQAYGFIGHVGFSFGKFLMNYSYEPGNQPETGFSNGSHEVQIGLRLGDLKKYRKAAPVFRSTLQRAPDEQHQARFQQAEGTPGNIAGEKEGNKKTYYVVLRAFSDFTAADAYKKKIVEQKFNADIFYYEKEKKFYVYVLNTLKASEAYEEARNLKAYTKLKEANVLIVQGSK